MRRGILGLLRNNVLLIEFTAIRLDREGPIYGGETQRGVQRSVIDIEAMKTQERVGYGNSVQVKQPELSLFQWRVCVPRDSN